MFVVSNNLFLPATILNAKTANIRHYASLLGMVYEHPFVF